MNTSVFFANSATHEPCSPHTWPQWALSRAIIYLVVLLTGRALAQVDDCSIGGGGPSCVVQYKITGAQGYKCGVDEFIQTAPPRRQLYVSYSVLGSNIISMHVTNGADGLWIGSCHYGTNGTQVLDQQDSESASHLQSWDKISCAVTETWSGSRSLHYEDNDQRPRTCYPQDECGDAEEYWSRALYDETGGISLYGVNGVTNWYWVDTRQESHSGDYRDACSSGPWSTSSTSLVVVAASIPGPSTIQSETATTRIYAYNPAPAYTSGGKVESLTNLFSDTNLFDKVSGFMPSFPDGENTWYTPDPLWPDSFFRRIAYSLIDADHTGQAPPDHAKLQALQYRFELKNRRSLDSDVMVEWVVITWHVSTGQIEVTPKSARFEYTPDSTSLDAPLYTGVQEEPAPFWDDSPYGGYVIKFVDRVILREARIRTGFGLAGNANLPGAEASGTCATCGTTGGGSAGLQDGTGAFAEFSLGLTAGGRSAGALWFYAATAIGNLASPSRLQASAPGSGIEVLYQSGAIRQVSAPQAFVDRVTISTSCYELRFYTPGQFNTSLNAQGFHDPIGTPSPFVTWKIENPSTNSTETLRVTETRGSTVKTYDYTGGTSLTLAYPGGLAQQESTSTIVTNDTGYTRTVVTTRRAPGGAEVQKVRRVYQNLGNNDSGCLELLVEEVISPDADPQTNRFTYYNPAVADGTFRPLKLATHANGSWEYYEYDGRHVSTRYTGYGDASPPASGGGYTYTTYGYSPLVTGDAGTNRPDAPRMVSRYVDGTQVETTYYAYLPFEEQQIRCPRPYAPWYASDNLVTTTHYFDSGPYKSRIKSTLRPDGTMTLYDYADAQDGSRTNTVWTGAPNTAKTAIIDGTREIQILGMFGQLLSRTVTDIATSAILQQDVYSDFDMFSRAQKVTHLDGTSDRTQFSCCGVDSVTDRDGVTTSYGYDAMKRQTSTTRLNVTTATVLDAAGRVLKTTRTGSDSTQMVLSQAGYDLHGRVTAETNALGGITSYSETTHPTTGDLIRTTTYPDGGTRIEAYYRDGTLKQVTGTAVHGVRYEYGTDVTYSLTYNGTDSGEWTMTYSDPLGRPCKTVYADDALSQSFYNDLGQLWKEVDPDGVVTLYQYNAKGELTLTAVDVDHNDQIDLAGADRVSATISDLYNDSGTMVQRSRSYLWDTFGQNQSNLVSESKSSLDGLRSWQIAYRDATTSVTSWSSTAFLTNGTRYVTNGAPDGSRSLATYTSGRLTSVVRKDSLGNQIAATTYTFDPHGRQLTVSDARSGATTYGYNAADQVATVTTPVPSVGQAPQITRTYYNKLLQATNVVQPDGSSVFTEFYTTGELKRNYGSRTYPVEYTYDYAGRVKTMKTWQNFASGSGAAVTTWNYRADRGWLSGKRYENAGQGSLGPDYTYTPGGRLKTRTWARGVVTTYGYGFDDANSGNDYPELVQVDYTNAPQATPSISYTYDRAGRQATIAQNPTTTTLTYNLAGEPVQESYSGGPLNGLSVTNGYDHWMRRTNVVLRSASASLHSAGYSYDEASRLRAVLSGQVSATYSYLANSPLVSQIAFTNNGVQRMVTSKQYDLLNRLENIKSVPSSSAPLSFDYAYNLANQRTLRRETDASYWRYDYDSLGQVISGKKYWADGAPVAGQQFQYAFDDIGNRLATKAGGDENGANFRTNAYYPNLLNQYTSRTVPGAADIIGVSLATNTMTVNSLVPYRKGEYFRKELAVNNSSTALWTNITVAANGQTSVSGNIWVSRTPEAFGYDSDGNLVSDGRWNYGWDAENRLVAMTNRTAVGPQQVLRFDYDVRGRRIRKQVWDNAAGTGNPTSDLRFVYDGWNLIDTLDSSLRLVNSYTWGLDLSGSIQGGGGVGGLLVASEISNGQVLNSYLPAFDGNGNMAALIKAGDGTESARYEYGP